MKNILITLASLGLLSMGSINLSVNNRQEEKVDTLKRESKDLVCGMKVKAGTIRTFNHEKVVYGFCSDVCKKKFVAEPKKYVRVKL